MVAQWNPLEHSRKYPCLDLLPRAKDFDLISTGGGLATDLYFKR